MSNEQTTEAPYREVLNEFSALKLEDKAKFLLEATFSTVFGAFEELVDLASETYTNVAEERKESAKEKKTTSRARANRKKPTETKENPTEE